MDINDYKDTLINMINATNDKELLNHWKTHIEREYEQYKNRPAGISSTSTETSDNKGKDSSSGYVVLESGLGIDE